MDSFCVSPNGTFYFKDLLGTNVVVTMSSLADLLRNKCSFRVHTGNINSWGELKSQSFQNSAEELTECLRLQLEKWQPNEEQITESENGKVTLSNAGPLNAGKDWNRDDLKITLKMFLRSPDPLQAEKCLDAVLSELEADRVERLIVSFPTIEISDDLDTDEEEAAEMLNHLKPLWTGLEDLVEKGKAGDLGAADLDLSELKALYDWAPSHKPSILHFNIQACCTVPPELKEYAKEREIQLLTHNDPKPFVPDAKLKEIVCGEGIGVAESCCERWGVGWVARYTVMIRSRSVIVAKGYLVNFKKNIC